ncbi:hypothetical protein SmJEL517_g05425 [Synchytrium microbalum]|uniref:Uncharacterized protein n=1 Tax=Synchytrium microbalum TaxID=1806994 RepID=A0A507BLH1_9FUNG|nr:uncharacterized protein SmJEL517_g05425 [Synchytrium microbalum]TPX31200.1 hypothetical protein SmJEL517_g05425 [Synchytrium microbalum]
MLKGVGTKFDKALSLGAIVFTSTIIKEVPSDGVMFQLRLLESLQSKPYSLLPNASSAAKAREPSAKFNPFLPYDEKLYVDTLNGTHNILFNKYCIVRDHLLITTRDFQNQYNPLTESDFKSILDVMDSMSNSLAFFNCGHMSGASVLHKHIQVIPVDSHGVPMEVLVNAMESLHPAAKPFQIPSIPFAHAAVFIPPSIDAKTLTVIYRETLLAAFKNSGQDYSPYLNPTDPTIETPEPLPPSYAFLMTRRWMLIVPRREESWNGISVNSVGFSGMVFVKRAEDYDAVTRLGMFNLLKELTYPKL